MLWKGLAAFSQKRESYALKLEQFSQRQDLTGSEKKQIMEILSEFLMKPDNTDDVCDCFPQLLPALVSAGISMEKIDRKDGSALHRLNCVILGKLLRRSCDMLGFALHYFDVNPAPFETADSDCSPAPKKRNKRRQYQVAEVSEYALITACYDILCSAPTHFKYKWDWSKFYKYLDVDDEKVKWTALRCVSVVLGMSETCQMKHASSFLLDTKLFLDEEENAHSTMTFGEMKETDEIAKSLPSVVSIGGILLPVLKNHKSVNASHLIPVPSTRRNLRNLALAVSSNKCVCLHGAVGSGKTALVECLAQATGHDTGDFSKVQLGDQTDSKMLLGMYRCTDIPGEFLWQPGILTEAVLTGKWLLLEDIDCAATDVASVIGHLVETNTLSVPGYRDSIWAKSGFQLFLTRRLTSAGTQKSLQVSSILQKHWACVNVEPLSKEELVTVIQSLFPILTTVATRMVDVFLLFSVGNHEDEDVANCARIGRQTSTRDLMKWCSRAVVDFDVSSPDSALKIFQDALDVFCCSVPNFAQRLSLAISVAYKLGIVRMKAEYFCGVHKPSLNLRQEVLIIGRSIVQRKKASRAKLESRKSNFSYTRPSMCLLERIASCVEQKEPVLLVGETGTGKTSCVQYLAQITGHKLIVINMNQQSESADLLGGYKPIDLKLLISPIREEFEMLFRSYYAVEPNRKFLNHIGRCFEERKWRTLESLMIHSTTAALKRLRSNQSELELTKKWERMAQKLEKLRSQVRSQFSLAFSFVEGSLVKALRNGDWVLLDEINLATAETLECLSGLLESSCGSLSLLERGDREAMTRHQDFAVFACMNPATDIGKTDLPTGLRNRFTEFFVDELTEKADLQLLVSSYLEDLNLPPGKLESIVKFYLSVRKEAENSLLDGTGHKPHYSLRTLCRALGVSAQNPCGSVLRSLYEAFSLSFLTQLDSSSYPVVQRMIVKAVLGEKTARGILGTPIPRPRSTSDECFICFEGYWIPKGDLEPRTPENYILTGTVKQNLKDLVRVVSIGKMPVLLQGDTSVGKTSLITYLAKASGHTCVRINNHEHTDLQEYVGTYVADSAGKLVFKEGVLVDAMRKGYWIILDELNLAPSDVLEALNRVLDDNRELFIPETQQVVKAHDKFMLFATQNPPGLYGGRKVLSRAFRNRFVELHFDEIPAKELQVILQERCKMPETYCKQVISVMTELQLRRKSTATFAGKKGFITLRDLFRWAERYHLAPDTGSTLYDWSQHLADEGYLVLSSKVRHADECSEIVQVLKKHLKRDVDPEALFSLSEKTSPVTKHILESLLSKEIPGFEHVVWTFQMRKMAVLLRKACDFKEPVLLIGETGGGKTTVCQLLAALRGQELSVVNCHMHTEASDFLGSLRPVREHSESQKLFEWVDGPLVKAMKNGGFFLIDEISLADDSVLERLNSLLEPERRLLVAEKPSEEEDSTVVADENFIFVGTMNPGGDYGKKELSPALRNRFTEVWCEGCVSSNDLRCIMVHNLRGEFKENVSTAMLNFLEWLKTTEIGKKLVVSVRDVLTWVNFVNICKGMEIGDAYYHGASLSYLDGLGSGLTASENSNRLKEFKNAALKFIETQARDTVGSELSSNRATSDLEDLEDKFGIPPFYVEKGTVEIPKDIEFAFASPTTRSNTLKLLRALQMKKPILLEGSPGVGKTSLVSALARASGHPLLRLNLSDQTDISDLFGADLPVEGGKPGEFSWRDGPFLRALKNGDWILLDELNLASQSVLEGLNACLDHRGELFVPELGKTFSVKPGTRLFGCQNPLRQGGARRGLPKSFLNRFTQVFVDALEEKDLKFILKAQFPELSECLLDKMIRFNERLSSEVGVSWAHSGSPWEMNLRDVTRWCQVTIAASKRGCEESYNPGEGVELIYVDRMRTWDDKERVRGIYEEMFPLNDYPLPEPEFPIHLAEEKLFLGNETLSRKGTVTREGDDLLLLREQKTVLRDLARCVNMNWMAIIVGNTGCGKSSLVRLLANLAGQRLKSIVVNSAMDTTEILGGFEQTDYNRHFEELFERSETLLIEILREILKKENLEQVANYHGLLERIRRLSESDDKTTKTTMSSETELFLRKTEELSRLVSAIQSLPTSRGSELQEIQQKLRDLSIAVESDRCLNAGGKFEWVDSVLVKCLQNGTWLLLDQVNLCSPAILDRLNGLLEPNGALTIGEKGVDNCGNVFTVRPHKNFRLFLTMDPRYGEISRAMRNRGVEISVLAPKEISDYNRLDVKSLLNNCGIKMIGQQNVLLRIHEKLSRDKFGLIELLQAASFTSQQIAKGFDFEKSLRNSCREIYTTFDSKSRKEAMRTIDEILSENPEGCETFSFDLNAITPRICDLRRSSKLTIVKQQGFLLKSTVEILRHMGGSRNIDYSNLFGEQPPIVNSEEFLQHLLLDFYERSSVGDLQIRYAWISKIFSSNDLENFVKLNDSLNTEIDKFELVSRNKINLELPMNFLENSTICNNLSIVLYFRLMTMKIAMQENLSKKKEIMSLEEYSNAVCSGKVSSHLKNEPLITYFVKLIDQSKKTIETILHDEKFSINDKQQIQLRDDLKWYRRFHDLGKMELIDKSRGSFSDLREVSSSLKVHYKWLLKFFKKFFELLDPKLFNSNTQDKLTNFLKICTSVSIDMDRFKKIRKRIRKSLQIPSPHFSEDSMNFHVKLSTILKRLEINEEDTVDLSRTRLKIVSLGFPEKLTIRRELIEFIGEAFQHDQSKRTVKLSEMEELAAKIMEVKEPEDEHLTELNENLTDNEIEIWPIYEFFCLVFASYFQRKICEKFSDNFRMQIRNETNKALPVTIQESPNDNVDENQLERSDENSCLAVDTKLGKVFDESIFRKFGGIPTIPPRLIGLLQALNSDSISINRKISLLLELFFSVEEFTERSFVAKNSTVLSRWNNRTKGKEAEEAYHFDVLETNFIDNSTLYNLIFEVISTASDRNGETINLGNHKKRKGQLKTLQNLLWTNSIMLSSSKYDFSTNDSILLQFYIDYYASSVEDVKDFPTDNLNEEERNDLKNRLFEPTKTLRAIEKSLKVEENAIKRGNAWLILGHLQIFLFSDLGSIDPVQKIALKSKYIRDNLSELEHSINVEKLQSFVLGISLKNNRYLSKLDHLKKLTTESESFDNFQSVRPTTNFQSLREEVENFSSTIGSFETIFKQMKHLNELAEKLRKGGSRNFVREKIRVSLVWKKSIQRFSGKLERDFAVGFPDLVVPIIWAISCLRHGISILVEEISNLVAQNSNAEALYNLLRFPAIGQRQENYSQLVKSCFSENAVRLLEEQSHAGSVQKHRLEMTKIALSELENLSFSSRICSRVLWNDLNDIFWKIRVIWREQEKEKEEKLREEQSLFRRKFETAEEEELNYQKMFPGFQQDFLELQEAFPGFHQSFPELERIPENILAEKETFSEVVSAKDARDIREIHSSILKNYLSIGKNGRNSLTIEKCGPKNLRNVSRLSGDMSSDLENDSTPNFVDPLIHRFELLGSTIKTWPRNLSSKLITSLNVLISTKSNFDSNRNDRGIYDFYRDPNVEEIEECQPYFDRLSRRINDLLKEWPENPMLNSIKSILERILGFSITSSLSRFLVGVELLVSKIHQWEENARFDVSLAEYIEFFGGRILHWRKIEISRWKDSLEVLEQTLKTEASKWWFFLFDLIDQYLEEQNVAELEESKKSEETDGQLENVVASNEGVGKLEKDTGESSKDKVEQIEEDIGDSEGTRDCNEADKIPKKKLIESLERFLTESSLIEFESRLQLIFLFLRHIDHLENTAKKRELSAILWNVYHYYNQFSNDVGDKIKVLKDPIAKKLKDTIKITRWNDLNYWSVKNTAEKTRRTLHKLVKELQKALQQNVASYLNLRTKRETVEVSYRKDPSHADFVINLETRKLTEMAKLTRKARQFCHDIVRTSDYSQVRKDIESFVEETLEESYKLRDLEVEKNLPKAKRDSQAKSILQRKKMMLANYFKSLARIGISYRVGILTWKNRKSEIIDFTSVPLDLSELQRYEFKRGAEESLVEKGLMEQWSGCDKYYYGSLIKLNTLDAVLNGAKSDLGVQNAERCRGFSVHLVLLAHRQKKSIAGFFEQFMPLRIQISNFATMMNDWIDLGNVGMGKSREEASVGTEMPRQKELQSGVKTFRELLTTLEIALQQVVIFLESSPAEFLEGENMLDLSETQIPILRENNIARHLSLTKESLNESRKIASEVDSWISMSERVRSSGQILFLHRRHFDRLRSSYNKVGEIKERLIDLRNSFSLDHPIAEHLTFLIEKIDENEKFFGTILNPSIEQTDRTEKDLEKYRKKLDTLMTQILLVVQKKLEESRKSNKEKVDLEEDSQDDFEENALTERLIGSLRKDVSELRLKTVSRILGELLQIIYELDVKSATYCIRLLLQRVPLLEQYALFLHYYLHEQVAAFRLTCKFLYLQLNVFLDLAANGFCQPKDADPSQEDGEGADVEGGMGLADGEGQKDVSDKIETEDQLEEARRPDQEKENDDKRDTKEEENGIDMSEDFDGRLQDLEQGEEGKDDEDNEDLDKEMGETEENAEKLNDEIWKDEEEENDEENGDQNEEKSEENKKEEKGRGEEIGEDQLTAKDDEESTDKNEAEEKEREGKNKNKEEEKKDINEFEEPEMDEDHIDPYHGKNQPEIEPEPFDLPEDVDLDDEMKEDNPEETENPFDIDQMKESKVPEEKESEVVPEEPEDQQKENQDQDSSDEEDNESGNEDAEKRKEGMKDLDEKDEKDSEEQNMEDEKEDDKAEAQPSLDEGSKEVDASEEVDSRKDGSRDAVESKSNEENVETDPTERNMDDKRDKGTGQSQTEERTGHSGCTKEENVPTSGREKTSKPIERRRKPGESDENRSLLDDEVEPRAKKLKTAPTQEELQDREDEGDQAEKGGDNDVYEHIKNTEEFDDFALDAATEEQVKKQASNMEQDNQMDDNVENEDIEMHEDSPQSEQEEEEETSKKQRPEKTNESKKDKPTKATANNETNDIQEVELGGEIDGETVETTKIQRGNESTFHTKLPESESIELTVEQIVKKRFEIEEMLSEWSRGPSSLEAAAAWSSISALTESSARELSEKLRLVLEPTLTSRLKGDYRTGRRINMRKIIPYIASEFRKDKIWLRRTKPSKRDYQIVLAIDDSSSMADNHSKELAFESLSLIGKAMTYLEVGQLSVINFGERVNILHPLGENFTEESGARLIQEMKFEQKKTMIGQLLDFTIKMFESHGGGSDNAKLVAILSDGRGIFSEGVEKVSAAVRRAKHSNIFLVFIIVDNPLNKDSILDIRMPIFENGKLLGIRSYMDNFPFPFYIILRDLNTLPVVLSDALRQWFEIVGRIDT